MVHFKKLKFIARKKNYKIDFVFYCIIRYYERKSLKRKKKRAMKAKIRFLEETINFLFVSILLNLLTFQILGFFSTSFYI